MPATQIQDLPVEIVLKVFQAFLGPRVGKRGGVEDLRRRQRPVLLTHICRDWRAQALSYPFLWTDIQIHGSSELFLSFFERSHPLPFDLTITGRVCAHRSHPSISILHEKLDSLDEGHLRRMRSIEMVDVPLSAVRNILIPMDRTALPALRSLNLRGKMHLDNAHDHHTPFLVQANSILAVTLSNICISCIPSQRTLTTLKLLTLPQGLDAALLRGIVESTPALTILILGDAQSGWVDEDIPQAEPAIINAPNLKTLVVTPQAIVSRVPWSVNLLHQSCAPLCHCTLRNLVAENLEHLEVSGTSGGQVLAHLVRFMDLRIQNKDVPPLRLILNGIENVEPVRDIPRHLFLHITPLTIGQPSSYTFTKEFLGAVLYFPAHERSTDAFDASEEYCRLPEGNPAFRPLQSKEGSRTPLLDPLFIQHQFEDDEDYESYWQQSLFGMGSGAWRFSTGSDISDSDSDRVVRPYGWQEHGEEDEYYGHNYWDDWEADEDGVPLEYTSDDPDVLEVVEDSYPQGLSEEEAPIYDDYLQTGVIYFDEDDAEDHQTAVSQLQDEDGPGDYVQTGVLYHDEVDYSLGDDDDQLEEQEVSEVEEGALTAYDSDIYIDHGHTVDAYSYDDSDEDQEEVQQHVDDDVYVEAVAYLSDGGYGGYESPGQVSDFFSDGDVGGCDDYSDYGDDGNSDYYSDF